MNIQDLDHLTLHNSHEGQPYGGSVSSYAYAYANGGNASATASASANGKITSTSATVGTNALSNKYAALSHGYGIGSGYFIDFHKGIDVGTDVAVDVAFDIY